MGQVLYAYIDCYISLVSYNYVCLANYAEVLGTSYTLSLT